MIPELQNYINNIKENKIASCQLLKLAVQRFEYDLKREDLIFKEKEVKKFITFCSFLKHSKEEHYNKPFILSDWQIFIVANIYGFYYKATNKRRFTDAYIQISRKNGKTALASAIAIYDLLFGVGSEVVTAANSRFQAKICYDSITDFVKKLNSSEIEIYRNEVKFNNNKIKVVSSESSKLDGLNCSTIIYDEFHESKSDNLVNVLRTSQASRRQPLFVCITTAGFNLSYPCYEFYENNKKILNKELTNDRQFVIIFELDEADDYTDKKVWIKANPNFKITVQEDYLEQKIIECKNSVSNETNILTKHFNRWCNSSSTWLPSEYINKSFKPLDFANIPEDAFLYVAVDLANNRDINAVTYFWQGTDGKYNFINQYYLPTDSANSIQDKEYFKKQERKGNIKLIPGNVTDYNVIINDILEVHNNIHFINEMAYDDYNATKFVTDISREGLNTVPFSQSLGNFNKPTKELERQILLQNVNIQKNDITIWMFENVELKRDSYGNIKPDKSSQKNKIDGVISMIMAFGQYLIEQ